MASWGEIRSRVKKINEGLDVVLQNTKRVLQDQKFIQSKQDALIKDVTSHSLRIFIIVSAMRKMIDDERQKGTVATLSDFVEKYVSIEKNIDTFNFHKLYKDMPGFFTADLARQYNVPDVPDAPTFTSAMSAANADSNADANMTTVPNSEIDALQAEKDGDIAPADDWKKRLNRNYVSSAKAPRRTKGR
jgi:hypothetical protein